MLTERLVLSRSSAYGCCSEYYEALATTEAIYGNTEEAECLQRKALLFMWGSDVMQRTPFEGHEDRGCITDEFALQTINMLDADRCVTCKCGDRPITCVISQDFTVLRAADASYEDQALPNQYYLIITNLNNLSGGWADHVGEIARNTTYTVPDPGDIIYDATLDDYYVRNDQGETTELFPRLDASLIGTTLTVTSPAPNTSAYMDRDCVVEVSPDATTWTAVYSGAESVFDPDEDFTVASDSLYIRTTYYTEDFDCTYGPFMGLLTPDTAPPQAQASFAINNGNSYAGPVSPQALSFNFVGEPTWTIAYWFRSDTPGGTPYGGPLYAVSVLADWDLAFGASTPNNIVVQYFGPGVAANYENATANDIISDGAWHHVCVVRTALDMDTAPLLYVDGIFMPLTLVSGGGAGVLDSSPVGIYLGDFAGANTSAIHMGEVYACSTARTQSDVQNIIIPNLMNSNDGGWGRLFWYHPSLTDNIAASPWVDGNAAGAPDLKNIFGATIDLADAPPIP